MGLAGLCVGLVFLAELFSVVVDVKNASSSLVSNNVDLSENSVGTSTGSLNKMLLLSRDSLLTVTLVFGVLVTVGGEGTSTRGGGGEAWSLIEKGPSSSLSDTRLRLLTLEVSE